MQEGKQAAPTHLVVEVAAALAHRLGRRLGQHGHLHATQGLSVGESGAAIIIISGRAQVQDRVTGRARTMQPDVFFDGSQGMGTLPLTTTEPAGMRP